MPGRDLLGAPDAVAVQCRDPAIGEPGPWVSAAGGRHRHTFMIAAQADDLLRKTCLKLDQKLDRLAAAPPAIDVIAETDQTVRIVSAMRHAAVDETAKLRIAAMDITDRIGEEGGH